MNSILTKKIAKQYISLILTLSSIFLTQSITSHEKNNIYASKIPTYRTTQQCLCDFCIDIQAEVFTSSRKTLLKFANEKNWTVIIYMSADNDLRTFAARNIKQMANIGSNEHLNILVHLDIRISGNKKITRRYYIEKNRILHVNVHDPATQQMDSGDPQTLISCCSWGIENYPAKEYALIFWNHGTGPIDPIHGRIINPAELFTFNPTTNRLELDRSIGFLDLINSLETKQRGICWDNTTGNYLTNQKLDYALNEIYTNILHQKKFSIIGFDACLMSTVEVTDIIKKYAYIMVGSQEVELGTGWNYTSVLRPFVQNTIDKRIFAKHIVDVYKQTYNSITNDYTLSAIDLEKIELLEQNIDTVAKLLTECLTNQENNSVKKAIKVSRNKLLCTHFDEPSYIDLHHFYHNLFVNLKLFRFNKKDNTTNLIPVLKQTLQKGTILIEQIIFANTCGRNLKKARGISICFPERRIHSSYRKTTFAQTNAWGTFLPHYLLS